VHIAKGEQVHVLVVGGDYGGNFVVDVKIKGLEGRFQHALVPKIETVLQVQEHRDAILRFKVRISLYIVVGIHKVIEEFLKVRGPEGRTQYSLDLKAVRCIIGGGQGPYQFVTKL